MPILQSIPNSVNSRQIEQKNNFKNIIKKIKNQPMLAIDRNQ